MARLAVALALVALLAGPAAAQQALNLNLVKGPGATLSPALVVGSYKGPITEAEFNTPAFDDKTGGWQAIDQGLTSAWGKTPRGCWRGRVGQRRDRS